MLVGKKIHELLPYARKSGVGLPSASTHALIISTPSPSRATTRAKASALGAGPRCTAPSAVYLRRTSVRGLGLWAAAQRKTRAAEKMAVCGKEGRYGQPADCPRLTRALGNPRHELARTGASGEPAGRVRAALVSTRQVLVEAAAHLAALLQLRPRAEPQPARLALGRRSGMGHVHTIEQRGSRRHLGVAPRRGGRPQ